TRPTDKPAISAFPSRVPYGFLYAICTEVNLPLVTYHPVIGEIDALWKPARSGPTMYWYGWMLSALIGATAIAFAATAVPEAWTQRALAFGVFAARAYLVLFSLSLFVYDGATVELELLKSRWLSIAGAQMVGAIGTFFMPLQWRERVSPAWSWIVPAGAIAVLSWYFVPYFTR